jgi:Tfp pilus assembly protein PilV
MPAARSRSRNRQRRGDGGFSLVEVLVSTLLLTTAFVAMAQLLGISTVMHTDAREASTSTQFAQAKIDELMKLNFTTDAAVQVTAVDTLSANTANYFDQPRQGVTRRWVVTAGPTADTRLLRVRVVNKHARQYGSDIRLTTMLRQW